MGMPMIDEEAVADFLAEAERAGFDRADFSFVRTGEKPGDGPVVYWVVVSRGKVGAEMSFKAGHGHAWSVNAVEALRAGHFGRP